MYEKINIESSYLDNDLGRDIYDIVVRTKPTRVIEFGTLNGYSAAAIAMALKDNGHGHLYANDLWESYPYKKSTLQNCSHNLEKLGLKKYVTLGNTDFWEWLENPSDFDLLHIDISNTGNIIQSAYESLKSMIESGSIVIFEGGSRDRDKVEWMKKYNKEPIYPLKNKIGYKILNSDYPSISIIEKS